MPWPKNNLKLKHQICKISFWATKRFIKNTQKTSKKQKSPTVAWWKLRLHQRGVRIVARLQPLQRPPAAPEARRHQGEAARLQLGAEQLGVGGDLLQGDLRGAHALWPATDQIWWLSHLLLVGNILLIMVNIIGYYMVNDG